MKKIYGLCLKFNYNFMHDVLKKIGLELNLLQETIGFEKLVACEKSGKIEGHHNRKRKARKDD